MSKLTGPQEPALDLRKISKEYGSTDPRLQFLKGNMIELDPKNNGYVTKSQLNEYLKKAETNAATKKKEYETDLAVVSKELGHLDKLIKNFDKLNNATRDNSLGISRADIENKRCELLAEMLSSAVKSIKPGESPTLTPELKKALNETILLYSDFDGAKFNKFWQSIKDKLKDSPYAFKATVASENGPHGPTVRTTSFELFEKASSKIVLAYERSFDTVR